MKSMLRSSLSIAIIAFASSMNVGATTRGAGECLREYQACIAAGYGEIQCEDALWYCRYGYIPVKSSMLSLPINRQD